MEIFELLVALAVILIAAELFTNGIEWFGHKLNLAEGAVGSVLAAVGTALPETMIPLVAILFAGSAASPRPPTHIGVGAILGAPFMLSTLAMFVTGVGVIGYAAGAGHRASAMTVDTACPGSRHPLLLRRLRDRRGRGVRPGGRLVRCATARSWCCSGIYAWYVKSHFEADTTVDATDLAPLRLHRVDRRRATAHDPDTPRLRVINLQVLVALAHDRRAARTSSSTRSSTCPRSRPRPALLALIIAPIATELPEKFNSLIWVRQNKDTLAMGNITGAMVFQSCIPTAIGVVLAAERVDRSRRRRCSASRRPASRSCRPR